jgi:hypothetical protein
LTTRTFRAICLPLVAVAALATLAVIVAGMLTYWPSEQSSHFLSVVFLERGESSLEHYQSMLRIRLLHFSLTGLGATALLLLLVSRSAQLSPRTMIGLLAFLPLILVTIYFSSGSVVWCGAAIEYPYQWDYGEGNILDNVETLKQGLPLYTPFDQAPYTVVNYPPLYMLAIIALQTIAPLETVAMGRLLSCLCTLLTALVIGRIILRLLGTQTSRDLRVFASVSGGLVFLSVYPVWEWAPLMRVDILAVLFTSLGLLTFLKATDNNRWIYLSVAMFVLAGFTKQTAIAAPLACLLATLPTRRRLAAHLAVGIAGTAALVFLFLNVATDGNFYRHVIWANSMHEFTIERAALWTRELLATYPLFLVVSVVGASAVLLGLGSGEQEQEANTQPALLSNSLVGWFFSLALVASFTVGKSGSSINYFIELMMASSILLGALIARGVAFYQRSIADERHRLSRRALFTSLMLLQLLQLSHTRDLHRTLYQHENTLPGGPTRLAAAEVVRRIQAVDGEVLSTDHTLLILGGKRLFFETRDMIRFYDRGLVDQAPMVSKVQNAEFPLIVVRRRTHGDITGERPGRGRFTPAMLGWIKQNYQLDWSGAPYFIYVRKIG